MTAKKFIPIQNTLNRILQTLQSPEQKDYQSYQQLLNCCLPPKWHGQVIIGKIEGVHWQLWTADSTHAYQLRFLLGEVEKLLQQKLPHPPRLKVSARPDIKDCLAKTPLGVSSHYRTRHYSETEAEQFLRSFLQKNTVGYGKKESN